MMTQRTYTNPVYDGYLADPFVWQHDGVYYAVGTGRAEADGTDNDHVIPLLTSPDLVKWQFVRHALVRPRTEPGGEFWAPAVAEHDGTFFLYYSIGQCKQHLAHHLRVAVANAPEGPYIDSGAPLVPVGDEGFVYDAHPFRDDDGQWYLFYNRHFWEQEGESRIGEGIVVRRLITMTQVADEYTTIVRPHADWHRGMRVVRNEQNIDWHTVEGGCVIKHAGQYYCLFSGAFWTTEQYGVDYVVADHVLGPYTNGNTVHGPRVLQSVAGHVRGPGHNSLVLGPDEHTWYIVYHAWDAAMQRRQMCIDPLTWTADGPRSVGPTWTSQPIPTSIKS